MARNRLLLSSDEEERASRFHFEIHRRRFILARGAMRRILAGYVGSAPDELLFHYGPNGKPRLARHPSVYFNLSHSEAGGLLGVTQIGAIGVDIEYVRRRLEDFEAIVRRFFSPRESKRLLALEPELRRAAFFNCWTRKEAYIKAVGKGLALPLDRFDVSFVPGEPARFVSFLDPRESLSRWSLHHLTPAPLYVGAVALIGHPKTIRAWRYRG